ncbi:MAG: arsenosugar biosynthesis radical SAM (seleno)protein ArsS [Acidobacteriota bacterium]
MSDASPLPFAELASTEAGPKPTATLRARRLPLAEPSAQLAALAALPLGHLAHGADFDRAVAGSGRDLAPAPLEIFQINVGKLCNMTCRHCHVDAGPDRSDQMMDRETADACLAALDRSGARTVDVTGGAPELNPHFRHLVDQCVRRGVHVMDRCNLTVLLLPRNRDLPEWLAARDVEVVCSLPHWRRRNTDLQRGDGTFERSIEALRRLNAAGYASGDGRRRVTLVTNPVGAFLAGNQAAMEREWRQGLEREHGVRFDRLIALNNMPIARYLEWLESSGNLQAYMELLIGAFNPATVDGLMCRNTVSVGWDGTLYDCDFNQMLDLPVRRPDGSPMTVREFEREAFAARRIVTARHCFGCTAGCGSSCGGQQAR